MRVSRDYQPGWGVGQVEPGDTLQGLGSSRSDSQSLNLPFALLRWRLEFSMLVVAVFFGIVFAICAIGNVCGVIHARVRRVNFSLIPLIGGASGAVACLTAPLDGLAGYWWVPLLVDIGTAPLLVTTAVHFSIDYLRGYRDW